jgi:SagB-type dehydrogenase family enzyme
MKEDNTTTSATEEGSDNNRNETSSSLSPFSLCLHAEDEYFSLIQFYHENSKHFFYASDVDFSTKPSPFKEYLDCNRRIALPRPASLSIDTPLDKAILSRRSCRNFVFKPISLETLSKILYFGYGVTGNVYYDNVEVLTRPCPSGGALYPYEIYPIVLNVSGIQAGVYHYSPIDHRIELLKPGQFTNQVIELFIKQPHIANSSVCIVLSAVLKRTTWKYGARGYRHILLEAGHLTQNMCLVSTAEGLGTLTLGSFDDNSLAHFIGFDPAYEPPIYGLIIGYKNSSVKETEQE